jgi:hypothetical protein
LARISWATSAGRGLRYVPTQMLGQTLNNSDANALIRTRAAVEDTVDQLINLQSSYSSSRKSNQNHNSSAWLPSHRSQAHLFQARLVR